MDFASLLILDGPAKIEALQNPSLAKLYILQTALLAHYSGYDEGEDWTTQPG